MKINDIDYCSNCHNFTLRPWRHRRALTPRRRCAEWSLTALRFYWSYRDGAGDVERLLGKHFKFQGSHPEPERLASRRPADEGEIAEQGIEGMLLKGVCESVAGIFRHPFRFQSESPPGRRATFRGEARRLFERRTGAA